jgi:endogenous inhibitor of DNA gyrase (YacG/DUF329 family)
MSARSEGGPSKDGGCPVCGKPQAAKFSPFCSGRCADLDLGRWLKGTYVIPAAPDEAEAPADNPPPDKE